jgi:hypothetical protein
MNSIKKESTMGLKRKRVLDGQKAYFEQMLNNRLSIMAGKGIKPPKTDRDPLVKELKARIKAVNNRIRTILDGEKRAEDVAKAIAAAKAAPKEEAKPAAKAEKSKKGGGEGKEKKPKPEKKQAAPKAEAGVETPKTPKAPESGETS